MASENSRRRRFSLRLFDANCAQLIRTSTFRKNHRGDEISTLEFGARAPSLSFFVGVPAKDKQPRVWSIPGRRRDSELIASSNTC